MKFFLTAIVAREYLTIRVPFRLRKYAQV